MRGFIKIKNKNKNKNKRKKQITKFHEKSQKIFGKSRGKIFKKIFKKSKIIKK